MDCIFMLTRDDLTVEDCLQVYDAVRDVPLGHVGFKDMGVSRAVLRELHARLRADGRRTYLEMVSNGAEALRRSVDTALELGVDCLLGGTDVPVVLRALAGSRTRYHPFPGVPAGHPTRLGGSAERIARDTAEMTAAGCAGVDLLAYRATEADPLDLVRAARRATTGTVIVAGSIGTVERVHAVRDAGCDLFTIGTAVLDGSFNPRLGLLANQLRAVLAACA